MAVQTDNRMGLAALHGMTTLRIGTVSRAITLLVWTCVLLICAVMVWGRGKGYDFSDEAFRLITIDSPYDDTSDFGRFWHPVYVAVGGSVPILRLVGFAVLSACGFLFASMILRFARLNVALGRSRLTVSAGVAACVAWQYQGWRPTPDYNLLDLSALLLFFCSLLMSGSPAHVVDDKAMPVLRVLGLGFLCGLSLAVLALTKATSAILALFLGLLWLVLFRPSRSLLGLATAATAAVVLLAAAMVAIDGSIPAFIGGKIKALALLIPPQGGAPNNIDVSVTGTLSKPLLKVIEAASFALILLGIGFAWSCSVITERGRNQRIWLASALALLIAALVTWWRFGDLQVGQTFVGFRVWRLPLLFVLLAFSARVLWLVRFRIAPRDRGLAAAALILAIAPVAYSFGSDGLLIWKMDGATIFWAGAMILVAGITPQTARSGLFLSISLLCGATTIGLMASVVSFPGRIGAPLWQQTEGVRVGPRHSLVFVNRAAAAYITAFQRAARKHGFIPGTPVVDLSEEGPGLTFALGGRVIGQPPWLLSIGDMTNKSQIRRTLAAEEAAVARNLNQTSHGLLRRSWVITGDPAYSDTVHRVASRIGLRFPDGYRLVYRGTRGDVGRVQALWKPEF